MTGLFDRAGGERYPGSIENAPGPGLASVWTLYFAENPAVVVETALLESQEAVTERNRPQKERKFPIRLGGRQSQSGRKDNEYSGTRAVNEANI